MIPWNSLNNSLCFVLNHGIPINYFLELPALQGSKKKSLQHVQNFRDQRTSLGTGLDLRWLWATVSPSGPASRWRQFTWMEIQSLGHSRTNRLLEMQKNSGGKHRLILLTWPDIWLVWAILFEDLNYLFPKTHPKTPCWPSSPKNLSAGSE